MDAGDRDKRVGAWNLLMPGAAPAIDKDEGSGQKGKISRPIRTAFDLAVYASQ